MELKVFKIYFSENAQTFFYICFRIYEFVKIFYYFLTIMQTIIIQ